MSQVPYIEVVLSYDMDTTRDSNINNEIKGILIGLGWRDFIPLQDGKKHFLPSTTLVKRCLNLDVAKNSFFSALKKYDENHSKDKFRAQYTSAIVFESKGGKVL